MGMNIVVISPHTERAGNTAITSLLCMGLAARGRKVCMTHIKPKSDSIYNYFGINSVEDKTSNPHRLVKMLREGAVKPEDVDDYCKVVNSNFSIFSADNEQFGKDDMLFALEYIAEFFPHDFKVYDFDSKDLDGEGETKILDAADVVILVAEPNSLELGKFKERSKELFTKIAKKPTLMCINKYSDAIGSLKEVAAYMGIKSPNKWCTVRYNPYIQWATNTGKMKYIFDRMDAEDIRVIDINSDIRNLANMVLKVKVAKRQATMKAQTAVKEEKQK